MKNLTRIVLVVAVFAGCADDDPFTWWCELECIVENVDQYPADLFVVDLNQGEIIW